MKIKKSRIHFVLNIHAKLLATNTSASPLHCDESTGERDLERETTFPFNSCVNFGWNFEISGQKKLLCLPPLGRTKHIHREHLTSCSKIIISARKGRYLNRQHLRARNSALELLFDHSRASSRPIMQNPHHCKSYPFLQGRLAEHIHFFISLPLEQVKYGLAFHSSEDEI